MVFGKGTWMGAFTLVSRSALNLEVILSLVGFPCFYSTMHTKGILTNP